MSQILLVAGPCVSRERTEIWVVGWEAGCCGLSPASPRILWRTETEIWGWPGSSQWTLGLGWWVWWPLCPLGLVWPAQCHRDIRDKCHTLWCATSDEQARKWHVRSDSSSYKCFSQHLFWTKSLLSAAERRRVKCVHDFRMYTGRHIFNHDTQLLA